ncbi:hypothetical protein FISHEDRAFT_63088 [Fistulina hepatica ATCC 64428]|uniref:Uncharacterized protein n=1 Tax=Fistulina hepatica ATCC 64428 TaxID=1128425 RepID=A0A0D6ZYN0_9AGAR|nr:hypothetical protein FISHEDRAFT_63088 [Fistulina hepatica ATCC 64428]
MYMLPVTLSLLVVAIAAAALPAPSRRTVILQARLHDSDLEARGSYNHQTDIRELYEPNELDSRELQEDSVLQARMTPAQGRNVKKGVGARDYDDPHFQTREPEDSDFDTRHYEDELEQRDVLEFDYDRRDLEDESLDARDFEDDFALNARELENKFETREYEGFDVRDYENDLEAREYDHDFVLRDRDMQDDLELRDIDDKFLVRDFEVHARDDAESSVIAAREDVTSIDRRESLEKRSVASKIRKFFSKIGHGLKKAAQTVMSIV